ncbi:2-aminoethylphosphonate--pyruvate transaminase [Shewanella sp.]|uniref:2-aminoethylphosphonate--pyruvate transaminase n=1 Tax=Shewanella sp. TaxID=50422 RepID=UPI00405472BC
MKQERNYLLLTPGPLTTTDTVKATMLKDWCTWDKDYNTGVVEDIRSRLVSLATASKGYSAVLMQGSGTASVEAVIGSALGKKDKLLVINNGAYGARMKQIAQVLGVALTSLDYPETSVPAADDIEAILSRDPSITHVALVHCETTTGMLNPINAIAKRVKQHNKCLIVDAMSSFGGIEMDIGELGIDFLISSANKCIQGVPGFGFIIAKRSSLEACKNQARSLSLDLYAQWHMMETQQGKWRFTSPTHVVRAFQQALNELDAEGGVAARALRYQENQRRLVEGMANLGFSALLAREWQSPIISSFHAPTEKSYKFEDFYAALKQQGYVIYPGKVSKADCFRIGNIGDIHPQDIDLLLKAIDNAQQLWR